MAGQLASRKQTPTTTSRKRHFVSPPKGDVTGARGAPCNRSSPTVLRWHTQLPRRLAVRPRVLSAATEVRILAGHHFSIAECKTTRYHRDSERFGVYAVTELYEILDRACCQLRKGEVLEGDTDMVDWAKRGDAAVPAPGGVLEVYAMPSQTDPLFDKFEKVDLHFVTIAVDKDEAEQQREGLLRILDNWPEPDMLAGGPSYIAVGAVIGDQGRAFELFALGKVLGIWDVVTPEKLGLTGDLARQAAGSGFVMCTGYRPSKSDAAMEQANG